MNLMGGEEDYIVSGEKLSYSFIVDFSKASASLGNTTLTSVISAEKADPANGQVPEFSSLAEAVSVTLTEPVLTLESTAETEGLKQTLSLSYSSADPNPRASSIVLELQENEASLPFDSYIKVEKGGTTTEYYQKESGIFIIPLVSESTELDITLCSELFLKEACTFVFDVTYYTSLSSVGGSSLNGKKIDASATVLTFTKEESASPSLSVECEKRVYSADETLSVTVNYSDVGNCAITAYMSYKNAHGEYSSTAWSDILATNALNQTVMEIELGSYREHEGSYCLVFQVSESGQILFEVPYYFIIMEQ